MNQADTATELRRRGYPSGLAAFAVTMASDTGACDLHRHTVVLTGDGEYRISPRPWEGDGTNRIPLPAAGDAVVLNEVLESIELVDAWLDDAGPQWAKDCPEANMARRVGKAQLEAAEAMEELALLTGENPRKGRHPEARERMLAELGDTAVAALLGIQSQVKDANVTWLVFLDALDKALSRVPGESLKPDPYHPPGSCDACAESPFPPESGMTRQDVIDNGITG